MVWHNETYYRDNKPKQLVCLCLSRCALTRSTACAVRVANHPPSKVHPCCCYAAINNDGRYSQCHLQSDFNIQMWHHGFLLCGCSIPAAEWLDLSALGNAQVVVHAAAAVESILCHDVWLTRFFLNYFGISCLFANQRQQDKSDKNLLLTAYYQITSALLILTLTKRGTENCWNCCITKVKDTQKCEKVQHTFGYSWRLWNYKSDTSNNI